MSITIGSPRSEVKQQWLDMWPDYAAVKPPETEVLNTIWQRLLDGEEPTFGIFAYHANSGDLIGFLHIILHKTTWGIEERCYLQDAYVLPDYRRQGIFKALFENLIEKANKMNWDKIYWLTKEEYKEAIIAYANIGKKTEWIRYDYKLNEDAQA